MQKLKHIILLMPKLGYWNVAYMLWYRLSFKLGIRKLKFPIGNPVKGSFFHESQMISDYPEAWKPNLKKRIDELIEGKLTWFHYHRFQAGNPPDWFSNPFEEISLKNPAKHWTELGDFDLNIGDIKILWELSRFDWVTDLARGYLVFGDKKYLDTLNEWLEDWSLNNPINQGPNWKCGQETAIRVMKLISVSQILSPNKKATIPLQQMIYEHLERIKGNIRYSISQNNNHGTSESAALYIGSAWLLQQEITVFDKANLKRWKTKGRSILENRIVKLISKDGTFSQRSVNYHRVVVDTMSWVLYAMEQFNEEPFSESIINRLTSLGSWQFKMISSDLGEVPNLGSNDGAMFETFHCCDYRDFRPSAQLFFGILKKYKLFEDGSYNEPLFWSYPRQYLEFPVVKIKSPEAEILDGQFLIINYNDVKLFLKIPVNHFRPSANDAFHVDLWHKQKNILSDSGSYSYNAGSETKWFKSVQAHNTVQFGNRQQMPVIGRFLFGNWIQGKTINLENNEEDIKWSGICKDGWGGIHLRKLVYDKVNNKIILIDKLTKKNEKDVTMYINSNYDIMSITTVHDGNGTEVKQDLNKTFFSLYYMQKKPKTTYGFKTTGDQIITTIDLSQ